MIPPRGGNSAYVSLGTWTVVLKIFRSSLDCVRAEGRKQAEERKVDPLFPRDRPNAGRGQRSRRGGVRGQETGFFFGSSRLGCCKRWWSVVGSGVYFF